MPAKTRKRKTAAVKRTRVAAAASAAVAEKPPENLIPGQVRPPQLLSGPRKKRAEGAPTARLSNHKVRSQWFRARVSFPSREAPVTTLVAERDRIEKSLPNTSATAAWELIGPTNIGGRVTSLACHPTVPARIWAGAAGGGVWFSPDEGQSWTPQWHSEDVLNVGSLAIDTTNPDILYCGTGEANLSADSYPGVGLYRTLDAGVSWHLLASHAATGIPSRIGAIAIDQFDRLHIRIGGVGYAEMSSPDSFDLGGMYVSKDGGVSWRRETFISTHNYWCHSIVFDPTNKGRIFATFTAQGMASGIYRSDDGGATWSQLTRGLPSPARFGRTRLALAPSDSNVLYAIAADQQSQSSDLVLGVFRSRDAGKTWRDISGNEFTKEGQMMYGNTIVVHPAKPNTVICGGVDLHRTTNGGTSWTHITRWDATRGTSGYAHADHHALLMPASAPGVVYDGNDGGLDISKDSGTNWANRSAGLANSMSYDADIAQSDSRVYASGLQDNGTCATTTGAADDFFEILGGDGGWIVIDPADAGHLLASYYNFHIFRFRDGKSAEISPPAPSQEREQVWMCYICLDPNDSDVIFTGSMRIWRSRDDGASWKAVSPVLDGGVISAIEVADSDSKRVYAGTENGGIFRSDDGGETWSANIAGTELPGFAITRLTVSPRDEDVLYVTVANFGPSHVFRSTDGGHHWADIDKGQLPRVPHHACVVIEGGGVDRVYVGSDAGVFGTEDGGLTWSNLSGTLPKVMVVDLIHHATDNALIAATYGRSMWRLRL